MYILIFDKLDPDIVLNCYIVIYITIDDIIENDMRRIDRIENRI
jgi:hypothetical protein